MTNIAEIAIKLEQLNQEMLADLSDDEMDALICKRGDVEDQLFDARCTSMADFVAKRDVVIGWTSNPDSIHRHDARVFSRLSDDLLDVRRLEMMALLAA